MPCLGCYTGTIRVLEYHTCMHFSLGIPYGFDKGYTRVLEYYTCVLFWTCSEFLEGTIVKEKSMPLNPKPWVMPPLSNSWIIFII